MADDRPAATRPKLPKRGGGRPVQRNATFLALVGLVGGGLGFAVLITAVLTGFAPAAIAVILLIMGGVAFLFGGHYLLWGIWLDRRNASQGDAGPVEFWKRAPLPPVPTDLPESGDDP
jgi:hypothetical protein